MYLGHIQYYLHYRMESSGRMNTGVCALWVLSQIDADSQLRGVKLTVDITRGQMSLPGAMAENNPQCLSRR